MFKRLLVAFAFCTVVALSTVASAQHGNDRTLTVTLSGTGQGTVTGPGIDCGLDCSQVYANGTQVSLVATPAAGSTFSGWSGSCSGTGTCALSMTADRAVVADFTADVPPPPPPFDPGISVGVQSFLINYFTNNPPQWVTLSPSIIAISTTPWKDWHPGQTVTLPGTPTAVAESGLMMYICRRGPCPPGSQDTHRFIFHDQSATNPEYLNITPAGFGRVDVTDVQLSPTQHQRKWRFFTMPDAIQPPTIGDGGRTDAFPPSGQAFEAFSTPKQLYPAANTSFCTNPPPPFEGYTHTGQNLPNNHRPLFCPGDVVVLHLADEKVIPAGFAGAGMTQVERMLSGAVGSFGPPLFHGNMFCVVTEDDVFGQTTVYRSVRCVP